MKFSKLYHSAVSDRAINSFKTALACVLAFWVVKLFNGHFDLGSATTPATHSIFAGQGLVGQWVLVSVVVVMSKQTTVGSALNNSLLRIAGTLLGGLVCSAILFFDAPMLFEQFIFFVAIMIFVYLAGSPKSISEIGNLGAVTMAVVMAAPIPTIDYTLTRAGEIIVGISIALLITKFVLPIHARLRLRKNISDSIAALKELYETDIAKQGHDYKLSEEDEREEQLLLAFGKQSTLITDAALEFGSTPFNKETFIKMLSTQRKIYRTINALYHITHTSETSADALYHMESFKKLNTEIGVMLDVASHFIMNDDYTHDPLSLRIALSEFEQEVAAIDPTRLVYRESFDSYLKCIHYLCLQIENLESAARESCLR